MKCGPWLPPGGIRVVVVVGVVVVGFKHDDYFRPTWLGFSKGWREKVAQAMSSFLLLSMILAKDAIFGRKAGEIIGGQKLVLKMGNYIGNRKSIPRDSNWKIWRLPFRYMYTLSFFNPKNGGVELRKGSCSDGFGCLFWGLLAARCGFCKTFWWLLLGLGGIRMGPWSAASYDCNP